ncbi:MAG: hypothetical protein JXR48_00745 [Candidatus Delongbacteria bacterium]|nr:hypothetical protein [Candidatus Delongbacteria bacterium]
MMERLVIEKPEAIDKKVIILLNAFVFESIAVKYKIIDIIRKIDILNSFLFFIIFNLIY